MKRSAPPDWNGEGPLRAFWPGENDGTKKGGGVRLRDGREIWRQGQRGREHNAEGAYLTGSAVGVRLAAE